MVKCSKGGADECKSFKIMGSGIGFKGGRYVALTAGIAAKRAGSKLFQKVHNDPEYKKFANKTSIKFILKETTRGSKTENKVYQVDKVTLDTPKEIKRGTETVMVRYSYTVKRLSNETTI
jgi:hypothetical protein